MVFYHVASCLHPIAINSKEMRSPPPFIFMKILAGPPSAVTVLPPCVSRGGRSWLEFCTTFVGLIVRADFPGAGGETNRS